MSHRHDGHPHHGDPPPPPLAAVQVRRWQHGAAGSPQPDQLITEQPVALVFNGLSHAVMMATPTDLEAFALGFALSEGLLPDASHCRGIDVIAGPRGIEVRLEVSTRAFEDLRHRRRTLEGRSGCGLCGVDSLAALDQGWPDKADQPREPAHAGLDDTTAARAALRALAELPTRQPLNEASGACHAAGWADAQGRLLCVHEDVGRHNALDKLIGALARGGRLGTPGVVVLSSRASVELVRKCARVGLRDLATISAPTSMAVDQARLHGLRLMGFCRADSLVLYTP